MRVEQYLERILDDGEQLARAAEYAGPAATVPSCPGWTVAAAVGHLAKVHRWAAWQVAGGSAEDFSYQRPAPEELLDFFRDGLGRLVDVLASASDRQPMRTLWAAPSPRLFWARRQAHETAIHRVDLQLAAGYGVTAIEPDFAADGIDELVTGILPTRLGPLDLPEGRTVLLEPIDANASWTVRLLPDGPQAVREASAQADLSVFAPAAELYRWAWNRAGDDEVSLHGRLSLADWWHQQLRVTAG